MDERRECPVLAMYDVRGIQDYIFRTPKVKDAIGASAIVENIVSDAMDEAIKQLKSSGQDLKTDLEWYDNNGIKVFDPEKISDIQVLYIGGGNAFFLFGSRGLCIQVNRLMSKYIIESTYSLQLAIAIWDYTGDYRSDYEHIFQEMNRNKDRMIISSPAGALPVMDIDPKTGYGLSFNADTGDKVTSLEKTAAETMRKRAVERDVRKEQERADKIFDNYITEKGVDSTIAVVHIDGNNMGLRIRKQIENITDYGIAVNTMRCVSYRINHSYKKVFGQMQHHFNNTYNRYSVGKILVAGDDITYFCNGKVALESVEYFAKEVAGYTMDGQFIDRWEKDNNNSVSQTRTGAGDETSNESKYVYEYPLEKETDPDKLKNYGFSVCGGIAYIHSHFPFHVGYEVAEACCESAKTRAKKTCYTELVDGQRRIGNWVDFHICKNIQAQDLKGMREREYHTSHGEKLLLRPYFIRTATDYGLESKVEQDFTYDSFKEAVMFFKGENPLPDAKTLPRSFAKALRNTYPQGKLQVDLLNSFLRSRNWSMPDKEEDLYTNNLPKIYAKWYDALEMLDYLPDKKNGE